jgi:hypothetical protein
MTWEFLLQKEGDRSWLNLKDQKIQLPEGRYRLVVNSTIPHTDVDVRITHDSIDEQPPKRRTQTRSRRTNGQGLMLVIPFSHFKSGLWEINCNINHNNETKILNQSLQLRVISIEKINTNQPHTLLDINQNYQYLKIENTAKLASEIDTDHQEISSESNKEITPENQQPVNKNVLETLKERSLQIVEQILTEELAPIQEEFDSSGTNSAPITTKTPQYPSYYPENKWLKKSPVEEPESLPLSLYIDQDTLLAHQGQTLTITGYVEIVSDQIKISNRANSLFKGYLSIRLRDPQNGELLLENNQPLPKHRPPFDFICNFDLPPNCYVSLMLGEVTLYDGQETALTSQSFTVAADLQQLLYNMEKITHSNNIDLLDENEYLDIDEIDYQDYTDNGEINYDQLLNDLSEQYTAEETEQNTIYHREIDLIKTDQNLPKIHLEPVSNPIPAPIFPTGLQRNIVSPQLPIIGRKNVQENIDLITEIAEIRESLPNPEQEPYQVNLEELAELSDFFDEKMLDSVVQTPQQMQLTAEYLQELKQNSHVNTPDLLTKIPNDQIIEKNSITTEENLEIIEIKSEEGGEEEIDQAFASLNIQDKFWVKLNSLATDTEFIEQMKEELLEIEFQKELNNYDENFDHSQAETAFDYDTFNEPEEYETIAESTTVNYDQNDNDLFDHSQAENAFDYDTFNESEQYQSFSNSSAEIYERNLQEYSEDENYDDQYYDEYDADIGYDQDHSTNIDDLYDDKNIAYEEDDLYPFADEDEFINLVENEDLIALPQKGNKTDLTQIKLQISATGQILSIVAIPHDNQQESFAEESLLQSNFDTTNHQEQFISLDSIPPELLTTETDDISEFINISGDHKPIIEPHPLEYFSETDQIPNYGQINNNTFDDQEINDIDYGQINEYYAFDEQEINNIDYGQINEYYAFDEQEINDDQIYSQNDPLEKPDLSSENNPLMYYSDAEQFAEELSAEIQEKISKFEEKNHPVVTEPQSNENIDDNLLMNENRELIEIPLTSAIIKHQEKPKIKTKQIVIDDELPMPTLEELLAVKREKLGQTQKPTPPTYQDFPLPTPTLIIPDGELIAKDTINIWVKIPAYQGRLYIKMWIQDLQSRHILDGPRSLMDFSVNDEGEWETITTIIVPEGGLEVRFEAIAVDLYTQRESHKFTVDRVIIPANLPEFNIDIDDDE